MELDGRLLGSDFFLPHVSLASLGQPKLKGKVSDEKQVKSRENSDNDPKRNVNCFVTCTNRLPSPPPRNHPQLTGYFFGGNRTESYNNWLAGGLVGTGRGGYSNERKGRRKTISRNFAAKICLTVDSVDKKNPDDGRVPGKTLHVHIVKENKVRSPIRLFHVYGARYWEERKCSRCVCMAGASSTSSSSSS